jgi:hypothetical protein
MTEKPFSASYVLRTTTKHMRKSIDVSIRKTFERIPEFTEDADKSAEVFTTLMLLHSLRRDLDVFQKEHSQHFRDNR